MSYNDNTNKWVNWIEEAISEKHIKHYDYKHFVNIQEIGSGNFGKVFRANWKDSEQHLALKSFSNVDNITVRELVHELELQREVAFHSNIINFYGITTSDQEYPNDKMMKYLLVMEYADGGPLQYYLKKNFDKLTWENKYNLAYQLACAVSCLHDEHIVHCDLHSGNVLVHQNIIKVADFGLSKRIKDKSVPQSQLFGVVPYIDPKRFTHNEYSLNKKSDVYSIGVLLWELSSGKSPFCDQDKTDLALQITKGLRETIVPDTPPKYFELYVECWGGEPDKRPTMNEVATRLKEIINITDNINITYEPTFKSNTLISIHSILHGGELSQDSNETNTESLTTFNEQENILPIKDSNILINELIALIFRITETKEQTLIKRNILDYFDNHKINSQKLYNWLLVDQNNVDSIVLLGYFHYTGIETNKNHKKAFQLFINATKNNVSEQSNILAKYYIGICLYYGYGTAKNVKLAFGYFEEIANKNYAAGQLNVGYCYYAGIGVKKDLKTAACWYEKAADNGNMIAAYNFGLLYLNGDGIIKNHSKAFKSFEKSAKEYSGGIVMLGHCYENGIETNINKKQAFKLYQKAAELGNSHAQCNLAFMYKNGYGIKKNVKQAIYWYSKSAEQGYEDAINSLYQLKKVKHDDDCRII